MLQRITKLDADETTALIDCLIHFHHALGHAHNVLEILFAIIGVICFLLPVLHAVTHH